VELEQRRIGIEPQTCDLDSCWFSKFAR